MTCYRINYPQDFNNMAIFLFMDILQPFLQLSQSNFVPLALCELVAIGCRRKAKT